ncbi:MAG: hypothetical protein ACK4VN_07370 [Bacteroidales bacterium]
MNIQTTKLHLMKLILESQNVEMLEAIRKLLSKETREDFWNSLSNEQKEEIEAGIAEVEEGEIVDYEAILKKHRK